MPLIEGIEFDEPSHKLILELIDRLKSDGVAEVYGLPRMHGGKGELRMAHHAPLPNKPSKAKGSFARIAPRLTGAVLIRRTRAIGKPAHVKLSASTFDEVLETITIRRDVKRPEANR
jgi:hypothetical protein